MNNHKDHKTEHHEENDTEQPEEITIRYKNRECRRIAWLGALKLVTGDHIEVTLRGRIDTAIQGRFKCLNPVYGWLLITTDENEMMIKLKDVKTLRKLKR